MINVKEQEKLWESVETLSTIDQDQALVVFKTVLERSLRLIGLYTPFVETVSLKLPDHKHIQSLRDLDKRINNYFLNDEDEKAYEALIEYIDVLSNLTLSETKFRRQMIASILKQQQDRIETVQSSIKEKSTSLLSCMNDSNENLFYKPKDVAKRLGVSDQTVRRMCDKGKFPGAYQTDGGHWKIPTDSLITTEEQDSKAERLLQQLDVKNKEAGNVDEFNL